jgi:hypothetical protein
MTQPSDAEREKHLRSLKESITQARYALRHYTNERRLSLNAEQLFELVIASPIAFAISWDEQVDEVEKQIMQYAAQSVAFFFNEQFTPELKALFEELPVPDDLLDDRRFPEVLFKELRYLAAHAGEWQAAFTDALKAILQLDPLVRHYVPELKPLAETITETLLIILLKNIGSDHIEEEHLYTMLSRLGLSFSKELYMRVLDQVSND